jgi:hypothetical protein
VISPQDDQQQIGWGWSAQSIGCVSVLALFDKLFFLAYKPAVADLL